jgi:hypothetical protein
MYINNICYDNLLFVHIPKTAGQSIFSVIEKKYSDNWERSVFAKHDPFFILQKNNIIGSRTYKFAVVRNPFRRTYSHYKHFNKINESDYSFLEFIDFIRKGVIFEKTPMILYPQSFYCIDQSGDIGLNKIYKYEFLHELEEDLQFSLPHLNKGSYSEEDYFSDYSDSIKHFITDYFAIDFVNFNYCMDFI